MGYFYFNNVDSRDYGILQNVPYRPRSEQSHSVIAVPGRTEPLFTTENQFKDTTLQLTLSVTKRDLIDSIYSWLNGSGILILSDDLTKYYDVLCCTEIVPAYISRRTCQIPISFTCKPFRYAVNNPLTEYGTNADVTVEGTYYSEPKITVYGTGNIDLSVNGEVWKLADVDGYITIDTKRKLAYKDNTVLLNKVSRYDGRVFLPCFNIGINNVKITSGTATKLEIQKNERWL